MNGCVDRNTIGRITVVMVCIALIGLVIVLYTLVVVRSDRSSKVPHISTPSSRLLRRKQETCIISLCKEVDGNLL